MPERVSAVVLPGLDGTGTLLGDFADALGAHFDVRIIRYPPAEALGYDQLQQFIAPQLPGKPFVLIGESFSGPLALRISASRQPHLLGVALGASFARLNGVARKNALRLALLAGAPLACSPFARTEFGRVAASRLLSPLLLGRWATPEWRKRLRDALAIVAPHVLTLRAREALTVDLIAEGAKPLHSTLYLRATADRLIPPSAAYDVITLSEFTQIKDLDAPHFLFQAAPSASVQAILSFTRDLTRDP